MKERLSLSLFTVNPLWSPERKQESEKKLLLLNSVDGEISVKLRDTGPRMMFGVREVKLHT